MTHLGGYVIAGLKGGILLQSSADADQITVAMISCTGLVFVAQ